MAGFSGSDNWWREDSRFERSNAHLNEVLEQHYPTMVDALSRRRDLTEDDVLDIASRAVERLINEYTRGKNWDVDDFSAVAKGLAHYTRLEQQAERRNRKHVSLDEMVASDDGTDGTRLKYEAVDPATPVDERVGDALFTTEMLKTSALSELERKVLYLRFMLDLTPAEAGDALGMTANAVSQRTFTALARLRDLNGGI